MKIRIHQFLNKKSSKMVWKNKSDIEIMQSMNLESRMNSWNNTSKTIQKSLNTSIKDGKKSKEIFKKHKKKKKKFNLLSTKSKNLKMISKDYNFCSVIMKFMRLCSYRWKASIFLEDQTKKVKNLNIGIQKPWLLE